MPQEQDNTTVPIPAPVASVRSTGYKPGDRVTMYGKSMLVVGARSDGSPILDLAPESQQQQNGGLKIPQGIPKKESKLKPIQQNTNLKRGQWISNRLRNLYSDPVYTKASPDVQQYYKNKAYDKWVVPYYKHINMEPPTRDNFVKGVQDEKVHDRLMIEMMARKSEKEKMVLLKVPSQVLAGISSMMGTVAKYDPFFVGKTGQEQREQVQKFFKTSENYYDKQAKDLEDRIQDLGGHDLESRVTQAGAETIFFEAAGGASATSALRIANPRTAAVATRVLKTAWNGAVTGTLWGATTGSKPQELPKDAATFALFDLGLTGASAGFMKVFGRFIESGHAVPLMEEAASDLASGKGVTKPKVEEFAKGTPEANKQASKAAVAKTLNEAAQKIGGGETNGAFKKLSPKQQKALLTRLTLVSQQAKDSSLDESIKITHLEEEEAKVASVVPVAAKVQQQVDGMIKEAGLEPSKAKIGATLPHHVTTKESPIQHISARISFLRNQLKNASGEEADTFREALKQEQALYKHVKDNQLTSWYHGTKLENIESIMKEGLKPFPQNEMDAPKVFVTNNPKYAAKYPTTPGRKAIVIIKAPGSRFDTSALKETHEAHSTETIPPDMIVEIREYDERGRFVGKVDKKGIGTNKPQSNISTELPASVKGSKPRYKNFEIEFEDKRDLALYTVAQETKNKSHDVFMVYLKKQFPGKSEFELQQMGKQVRNRIKTEADKTEEGSKIKLRSEF